MPMMIELVLSVEGYETGMKKKGEEAGDLLLLYSLFWLTGIPRSSC